MPASRQLYTASDRRDSDGIAESTPVNAGVDPAHIRSLCSCSGMAGSGWPAYLCIDHRKSCTPDQPPTSTYRTLT